jgi:hypothetical protein
MQQQNLLNQARNLLTAFVASVKGATALGHTDINVISENVLRDLFRIVYSLPELRNLNQERRNYPGIDLADDTKGVAFQITATPDLSKIKETLQTVLRAGLEVKYPRIRIYVITEKQASYSQTPIDAVTQGRLSFDANTDVLDYRDVLRMCGALSFEDLDRVVSILRTQFPEISNDQMTGPAALPPVQIELNIDHSLKTPLEDLKSMVVRLATRTPQESSLGIEVVHVGLENYLNKVSSDPVERAICRKSWESRASTMARVLQLLFSSPVQDGWSFLLRRSSDFVSVATAAIGWFGGGKIASGTKFDVWRTTSPALSAPIYLNDDEVNSVLLKFGFNSIQHLSLGAGWRAADELPSNIIITKILPRVLIAIESGDVDPGDKASGVLMLASWHIGLG